MLYSQCTGCNTGYFFLTNLCLTACPTGYTQDSTGNLCTLSDANPLSLAFQDLIQLDTVSTVTTGNLNSNLYPTWDTNDPIPSIYRGYYFTNSLYMTRSSLNLSPFFTITV